PGFWEATSYGPGGSGGDTYWPSSFDDCLNSWLVSVLRIVTVAPARTAPVESVSVPAIVPVSTCATSAGTRQKRVATNIGFKVVGPAVPPASPLPGGLVCASLLLQHLHHIVADRLRDFLEPVGRARRNHDHVA